MHDIEHAKLMARLARNDLDTLQVVNLSEKVTDSVFGFHAQQSVEKSLKAWLSLLGVAYPRIHLLHLLFDLLLENGATSACDFRHLQTLTPYGIQYRYEESVDSEEKLDREKLIAQVGELLEHVENLIRKADIAK